MESIKLGYMIVLFGIVVLLGGFIYDYDFHNRNPGLTLETEGPFAIEHIPFDMGILIVMIGATIGIYSAFKK